MNNFKQNKVTNFPSRRFVPIQNGPTKSIWTWIGEEDSTENFPQQPEEVGEDEEEEEETGEVYPLSLSFSCVFSSLDRELRFPHLTS